MSDAVQKAASSPELKIDTAIGGSVLIVDDDKIFGQRLGKAFMVRGFDVRICETVEAAVMIIAKFHLDVVITDLRLGSRSGLAVVAAVKKASNDIKTLVLTGYGNISSAVIAVKLGATDVLSKPADVDEILEVLGLTNRSNSPPAYALKDPDLLQWEYILSVYEATGENVSKSARLLKMQRRTLQRMLARHQPEYRAERMIKR